MVLGSASCVVYGSVTHVNDFSREITEEGELRTTVSSIGMCIQGK